MMMNLDAKIVPQYVVVTAQVLVKEHQHRAVVLIVVVLVKGLVRVAVKAVLQVQNVLDALLPVLILARMNAPLHVQVDVKGIAKANVPMVVLVDVNHPVRAIVKASVRPPALLLVPKTAKVAAKTDARLAVPLHVAEDVLSNAPVSALVVAKEHVQVLVLIAVITVVP